MRVSRPSPGPAKPGSRSALHVLHASKVSCLVWRSASWTCMRRQLRRATGSPLRLIVAEPCETGALVTCDVIDELLEEQHPVPATDDLWMHRDCHQSLTETLVQIVELALPDFPRHRGRACGVQDAGRGRDEFELDEVVQMPRDRQL